MPTSRKQGLQFGVGVAVGLALILGGIWLLGSTAQASILERTVIGGQAVGGLSTAEAESQLTTAVETMTDVTLTVDGQVQTIPLTDLGMAFDVPATIENAKKLGADGNAFVRGFYRIQSWLSPITLPVSITVNEAIFKEKTAALAQSFGQEARDAGLAFKNGAWAVADAQVGYVVNVDTFRSALTHAVENLEGDPISLTRQSATPNITTEQARVLLPIAAAMTDSPVRIMGPNDETLSIEPSQLAAWVTLTLGEETGLPVVSLDQADVEGFVKTLAQRFNQDSQDARVVFANGKVEISQTGQKGRKLKETSLAKEIVDAAMSQSASARVVALNFDITEPEVSSLNLDELGLKELIGTATTSYAGSPDNRKHNIANGVKFLTSKLVKPGEEFSTVGALGKVDETTGYLPELVIKENRTIPEYGGGLCQVSTTLFRSALNAGLKITERRNHSYRVGYYETGVGPGLDATIYLPSPDLKFLNDTPGWILIQGSVNEKSDEVTFELYGTKDGRRSEVSKPTIHSVSSPSAPIYVETPDLPQGVTKQIEKAHQGAKTSVTYKVYRGDDLFFDQTFTSNYRAWPARYLVGTGAPVPSESPAQPTPTATETAPANAQP